jgi:hypothetical protein
MIINTLQEGIIQGHIDPSDCTASVRKIPYSRPFLLYAKSTNRIILLSVERLKRYQHMLIHTSDHWQNNSLHTYRMIWILSGKSKTKQDNGLKPPASEAQQQHLMFSSIFIPKYCI